LERSALYKPHITSAWPFLGILRRELHTLAFAQQFEHGSSHRAAVKEVLDSALVADEPETFVD
jgi:hypothetical protein